MSLNHRDLDYLYALNTYSLPVLPDLSTNALATLLFRYFLASAASFWKYNFKICIFDILWHKIFMLSILRKV